jgi:hypothetical protein
MTVEVTAPMTAAPVADATTAAVTARLLLAAMTVEVTAPMTAAPMTAAPAADAMTVGHDDSMTGPAAALAARRTTTGAVVRA